MDSVLERYILQIVKTEGPIHMDQVCKRIVEFQGTTLGARIKEHIEAHIHPLVKSKQIILNKGFLWWNEIKIERARDYSFHPKKDIELIAPEEIERAFFTVIKDSISIEREELIAETARCLGFKATAGVQAALNLVFKKMVKGDLIESTDGMIKNKI